MAETKKIIGFLSILLAATFVYITLPGKAENRIYDDRSEFYVSEDGSWVLGGIEAVYLLNGTTTLTPNSVALKTSKSGTIFTVTRTSLYTGGITLKSVYKYNGSTDDITKFPVSHAITIINGTGLKLQWIVANVTYTGQGETASSPAFFGHKTHLEWQEGTDWAYVSRGQGDTGIFNAQWTVKRKNQVFNVRLFDPEGDEKYIKLLSNTPFCTINCSTVYEAFANDTPIILNASTFSVNWRDDRKGAFLKRARDYSYLKSVKILTNSTVMKNVSCLIPSGKLDANNSEILQDGTCILPVDDWIPLTEVKLNTGGYARIKIEGSINPNTQVDNVLVININGVNQTYTQFAPWSGVTGLVACWTFDVDFRDNANGTYNGSAIADAAITTADKKLGAGSAVLDGTGDRVNLAAVPLGTDFTINGWINLDQSSESVGATFYGRSSGDNSKPSMAVFNTDGNIQLFFGNGGGNTPTSTTGQFLLPGWQMVTIYIGGSTDLATIWINGTLIDNETNAGAIADDLTLDLYLGDRTNNGAPDLDGKIDDVSLWNRPLTNAEISDLYATGAGYACPFITPQLAPVLTLRSPANGTQINNTRTVNFNISVTDDYNSSVVCTVYVNQTLAGTNTSVLNNTNTTFSLTNISIGRTNISANCSDKDATSLQSNMVASWIFVNDTLPPNTTLLNPPRAYTTTDKWIDFTWRAVDGLYPQLNCTLTINNTETNKSIVTLNNTAKTVVMNISTTGLRYWNVTCTDNSSNRNVSQTYNFTVTNGTDNPLVQFLSPTPANNTLLAALKINANFSVTDGDPLSNVTLNLSGTQYAFQPYSKNATNDTGLTFTSTVTNGSTNIVIAENTSTANLTVSFSVSLGGADLVLNNNTIGSITTLDTSPMTFVDIEAFLINGSNLLVFVPNILFTATVNSVNISYTPKTQFFNQTITGLTDGTIYKLEAYANESNGIRNQTGVRTFTTNLSSIAVVSFDGGVGSRKYELQRTVSINVTSNSTDTLCLDIGDTVNYSCFITSSAGNETNYTIDNLTVSTFNRTLTNVTFTGNASFFVELDNRTDVVNASIRAYGTSVSSIFPANITLDQDSDGRFDFVIPCSLEGNRTHCRFFNYDGTVIHKNITFATAGSTTFYVNISTVGIERWNKTSNLTYGNFSLNITGIEQNAGQTYSFTNRFAQDTLGVTNQSSVINASIGNVSNPWTGFNTAFEGNDKLKFYADVCPSGSTGGGSLTLSCVSSPTANAYTYAWINESVWDLKKVANITTQVTTTHNSGNRQNIQTIFNVRICDAAWTESRSCVSLYSTTYTSNSVVSVSRVFSAVASFTNGIPTAYDIYYDGVLQTTSGVSLSSSKNWTLEYEMEVTGDTGTSSITSDYIVLSSAHLTSNSTASEYYPSAEIVSKPMRTTVSNITSVYFDADELIRYPSNQSIVYSISCNNGTGWTVATKGANNVCGTPGNIVKWKAAINNTIRRNDTPLINSVDVRIIAGVPENVSLDIGADGSTDWQSLTQMNGTNLSIIANPDANRFAEYANRSCAFAPTCLVPVKLSTSTGGIIQLRNMNLSSPLLPFVLNVTEIDTGEDRPTFVSNHSQGNLTWLDLKELYYGSANVTVLAHSTDYAANKSQTIQVRYSKYVVTKPVGVASWKLFPPTGSSKNVEPFGQNKTVGIWRVTSQAYDDAFNVYLIGNQTSPACVKIVSTRENNKTSPTLLLNTSRNNQTALIIQELNVSQTNESIFQFVNRTSCSGTLRFPGQIFDTQCKDCVLKWV